MNATRYIALGFAILAWSGGCGDRPVVIQGTVASLDEPAHTLVLRDERKPDQELVLSFGEAEINSPPRVGDLLRVAYHTREGRNLATRVMNITRQAELSGTAKAGH